MKKHALIVAGGAPPSPELLDAEIARADFVIAADSGANALARRDIERLTLVGDFDSIAPDVMEMYRQKKNEILVSDTHKDETDTLLALDVAIARGARTVTILGALGKRLDHAYANIALLLYAKKHGAAAELKDEVTCAFLAKKESCFSVDIGNHVSVFSITKRCRFISSEGLAYPLDNLKLLRHKPIGVSNSATSEKVSIRIKSGTALVMILQ
ncbi:MAG: thiamine diphosphokinase [Eubacteriales bacterium]